MSEPTQNELDLAAMAISGHHCARSRERYEREVAAGTWEPAKLHSYNGQLRHLASSAVTMRKDQ